MTIRGTVNYQKISGGFWGIIDDEGNRYRPTEMPKALQKNGLRVEIEAQASSNTMSIFMWGTNIDIQQYKTL